LALRQKNSSRIPCIPTIDGASGNYCWTKDATADSASDSDNSGWANPSPLVECGGAGGTAGTYVETLDQFDTNDYDG
jgi:hypothetical protein